MINIFITVPLFIACHYFAPTLSSVRVVHTSRSIQTLIKVETEIFVETTVVYSLCNYQRT